MTAWDDEVDRATDAAEDAVVEEDFLKEYRTEDQIAEWYTRRYGITPTEAMAAHAPTQAEREDIFRNVEAGSAGERPPEPSVGSRTGDPASTPHQHECDHPDGHRLIRICDRCGIYAGSED